jgi:DNA-binding NarL/FixJ family response regulator
VRTCQLAVSSHRPSWLVLGTGLDADTKDSLIRAARSVSPGVHIAVLHAAGDRPDFDGWLRRGCRAYLPSSIPAGQLLAVLRHARAHDIAVVGAALPLDRDLGAPPADVGLTRRERDVLQHVSSGMRNSEIAAELTVSLSTVDFHMRNLLQKLGARNRVEAVTRARTLGLSLS